jgi:excinuclease ABC subunit C
LPFDSALFLKSTTRSPGIYQMFDGAGQLLYIGKAKNLRNRLTSYFRTGLSVKTAALVAKIDRIEVTVTTTESEALLLEQNLIKQWRPPYNILLRDDKSFPYIFLSAGDFPRIAYYRGSKREKGSYFGPYPSAVSVRESLSLLQQMFRVRQCEDSQFRNRSRACLQYQINRCTGPCVGLVSAEEYARQVQDTRLFLEGKSDELIRGLANRMEEASGALRFEDAARYRDQIRHLNALTEDQYIEQGSGDADVVAACCEAGLACVHMLYIRGGRMLGSRSFHPAMPLESDESGLLQAFLEQYYLAAGRDVPARIVAVLDADYSAMLAEAISAQAGRKVLLVTPQRGSAQKWLDLAANTARQNLRTRLAGKENLMLRFEALQEALGLEEMPVRIECFDISHSSGEAAVASCVVFGHDGAITSDYRRFNIEGITGGDDYAAMHQALSRRFRRLVDGEGKRPDLLLIDGGKGQVAEAAAVLGEYGLLDILVVGVAKGPERKAGLEQLVFADESAAVTLPADHPRPAPYPAGA